MCRLFAMLAPEPQSAYRSLIVAPNALVRQARVCPDGCGISLAVTGRAGEHFRHWKTVESAATAAGFRELARERTRLMVGHLRYATVGPRDEAHTHPFVQPDLVLAFQGVLGEPWRRRIRRELSAYADDHVAGLAPVLGQTSGELLAAWLASWIQRGGDSDPREVVRAQLARLVAEPDGIAGLSLVAAQADRRGLTLYAFRYSADAQTSPLASRHGRALVLASRPTDRAARWRPVPNGALLIASAASGSAALTVTLAPLGA